MEEFNDLFPPEIQENLYYYLIASFVLRTVIWLLFGNTIRKTMLLIAPENRFMKPYQAWFVAIPLFNIYWNFEVVKNLSNSLHNECHDRQLAVEERPGMKSGLLYAWTFLAINIPFPASILFMGAILQLVFFVGYWVKVSRFKTLLKEHDLFLERKMKNEDS